MTMTIEFPGKFATRITDCSVRLVLSGDQQSIQPFVVEGCMSIEVDMVSGKKYLVLQGFKNMDEDGSRPRKAFSSGSSATYLAKGLTKSNGLLLQYLPPNSVTSIHYHLETIEHFHLLAGSAEVMTWKGPVAFPADRTIKIDPFTVHQVRTGEQGSIILLEMLAPEGKGGKKDHYYLDFFPSPDDIRLLHQ
jgi:mannose-6-phosphate isomerase-like protein (cupin superfamily)